MKNTSIEQLFRNFYLNNRYILFEDLIDYFAIFGGLESLELNLYEPLEKILYTLAREDFIKSQLPLFLFDKPFRELLIGLAKGNGKLNSLLHRVKIGQKLGDELVKELVQLNIVTKFDSREEPLKIYPKQAIKKELRSYKIEPKLYFTKPFYRFWFAFIEPFISINRDINKKLMLGHFDKERYKLSSFVFEDLSNALLKHTYKSKDPIVETGSLWNHYSEFDIFAKTSSGKIVIGECKYKNRPVVQSELLKLKNKAEQSGIKADTFTLFSKSGFSKELQKNNLQDVRLFELKDFKQLLL